jgi:DNA-binding transcriptional MocR family regulator
MDQVESLIASDPNIKAMWCVPRFSNPTGEVYDEQTVSRIAALAKIAGSQFYVFWDNAYAVHTLQADANADALSSIEAEAKALGTQESIIQFGSTSKITFAGAGIGYMASSEANIAGFTQHFGKASIGSDKINQQRHVAFLKNIDTIHRHMAAHAEIIAPKFAAVADSLETQLADTGMGEWSKPNGGYFVSFETRPGLAAEVVRLASEAGVKLTPAGATYPHGNDPKDSNIRIAPTYPTLEEVKSAMAVFVNCVTVASLRQRLQTL